MPPPAITLEELTEYFHMPEKKVAAQLGMCLTSLKKICRAHGITRWPFRKLKSLERSMQKVKDDNDSISFQLGKEGAEVVMTSSRCSESSRAASRSPSPCHNLFGEQLHSALQHERHPQNSPALPSADIPEILQAGVHSLCPASNTKEDNDLWPSFAISDAMHTLTITNWSILWTIFHLKTHILKPLGGIEMTVSEDGSKAYLRFPSALAVIHARKVCQDACSLLQSQHDNANTDASSSEQPPSGSSPDAESDKGIALAVAPRHPTFHDDFGLAPLSTPRMLEPQTQTAKLSPLSGHQHDFDEDSTWTLPLAPATSWRDLAGPTTSSPASRSSRSACASAITGPTAGANLATNRWDGPASSVLLGPQSCGSLSCGSGDASSVHSEFEWSAYCLVSC